MKTLGVLLLIAAAYAGGYGYGRWYAQDRGQDHAKEPGRRILYYVDPMHPAYKSDKPGIAPDCGMKLEPVYADEGPAPALKADRKVLYYYDPKDPNYRADVPGLNPETGNDLVPMYEGEMPPGTVRITPDKQQLIGVRFGTAEMTSGARTIRAVGKVAYDETRIAHVHTRVEGWIEQVFVDFTGEKVKKGQPLFSIYSPEMLASQQEYLLALRSREVMHHSTMASAKDYTRSLIEAARRRLELFELNESQIEQIEREGKPIRNITVYSPITGYVTSRNAFPNQKIMPDTEIYTIIDLSQVWVMADLFEYEAAAVRLGQPVTVNLAYYPGKPMRGKVSYIQPEVDPATRTLKVRIALENPGLALKPEMFADVEFRIDAPARLTVPVEAVLDSGRMKTVFVDRGGGYFEPRHVETGERIGDRIQILKGLRAGERVVTSGNFLIDSESQLKAAVSGMGHAH